MREYNKYARLSSDPADYVKIYKAITYINNMTCIKFIPWDGKIKDFLLIWPIMYPKG